MRNKKLNRFLLFSFLSLASTGFAQTPESLNGEIAGNNNAVVNFDNGLPIVDNTIVAFDNTVTIFDNNLTAFDNAVVNFDNELPIIGDAIVTSDNTATTFDNAVPAVNGMDAIFDNKLPAVDNTIVTSDNETATVDNAIVTFDNGLTILDSAVVISDNVMTASDNSLTTDDNPEINYGQWIQYRKEESTIAAASISGNNLLKRSALDPANTLYGRLPGLTVLQNGGYGGYGEPSPTLFIRGIGTINSNSILVLVDGFERPLNSLVTEEIESITVLKDAGALALYGLRGANGVILVKTKEGYVNKVDIGVSYQHTFTTPFRFPEMADAATYAEAYNEGLTNEGYTPRYSSEEIAAYRSGRYPDLYPNVNWKKEVFREIGQRDQINVQARGGSSKVRFFSLINFTSDRGLLNHANENDAYSTQLSSSTLNVRTNLNITLTPSTRMDMHLLGKLCEWNRPGNANDGDLASSIYQLPANAFPVKTQEGIWGGDPTLPKNPVTLISATGYGPAHSRGLYADMAINQDLDRLVKGLSAEVRIGFDASVDYWDSRARDFLYESNMARLDAQGNPVNTLTRQYGKAVEELGFWSSVGAQARHANIVARLNYDKAFSGSQLNTTLIYKQDKNVYLGQFNTFTGQDIIAHAHYGLLNKYYVDVALSVSGTSRLPENNRWGVLPAISAAWNITNETFMKDVTSVNLLKLRASYGITGNAVVQKEYANHPFSGGNGFTFNDDFRWFGGMREGFLPSRHLTYEKNYRSNLGIDLKLFDKLSFTADAFYNRTKDILIGTNMVTSSVIGIVTPFNSDGTVENYGTELSAEFHDKAGDFSYTVGGMFSFARNKILEMNEYNLPYEYQKSTGRPVRQAFGLEAIGFFKDRAEIDASPRQMFSKVYPGDLKYKDQNNDGRIDDEDLVPMGYSTLCPEIYYSASFDLEYKGLGINALFQGTAHSTVYLNTTGLYKPLQGNTSISTHYLENRWIPGADNSRARYPRLSTTRSDNNYRPNSVFLSGNSYFKLRTAEIYYRFPAAWTNQWKIKSLKLFARGTDLFSLDKIKVTDPESAGTAYPTLRSYHLGFDLTF